MPDINDISNVDDLILDNNGETDCDVCGTPFDEADIEQDW